MIKFAEEKVDDFYKKPLEISPERISESDLENLPSLLQKYLRKIGILGTKEIKRVRLKQIGEFKFNPDSKWKSFTAEQYINTENMSFLWYAKIKMIPLINFHVIDKFINRKGSLNAKLFNMITVVDESGPKLDEGEFLRLLGEMPWYPSFFLHEKIKWNTINEKTLEIKLVQKDVEISGNLIFNESGFIYEFSTKRYYTDKDEINLEDWHGYWYDYEKFDGISIPTRFKVCWNLETQEYCYIRAKITDLEFNNPNIY